jgi:signal peptidase I
MARRNSQTVPPPSAKDTLREIIETIVSVVALVLLLKMFVAEAFVIPTGSMATTLLGAHKTARCPECGYEFPVNCSIEREPTPGMPPEPVVGCTCPNCRYQFDFRQERTPPPCVSGDRLVVGKYLYDLHLNRVARQDVVVFKYPEAPQRHNEAMNYIKRLIGEPGDTIAIRQGDLYVYPGSNNHPAPPLTYENRPRPAQAKDLWQPEYMYRDDPEALGLFRQGKFQIIRKPPDKVLALRRLVYDNDHQARDLVEAKLPRRWAPEATPSGETTASSNPAEYLAARREAEKQAAWVSDGPHGFRHRAGKGDLAWLRYRNLIVERSAQTRLSGIAPSEVKPELITDFIGYDSWRALGGAHSTPPSNWVGDLMLECEVSIEAAENQQPQPELVFELSKGADRFQARWELPSGNCTLTRLNGSKEELLGRSPTTLRSGSKHLLRFANVDERLLVWVDNRLPFGNGVAYPPPTESGPFANDLEPAGIAARSVAVHVGHLKLWRDTYYTLKPGSADAPLPTDDWSDPSKWQVLRELPAETFYIQPSHYFCLGDNSPESADSRYWGLVPERLLLGRALFVYYPFWRVKLIE